MKISLSVSFVLATLLAAPAMADLQKGTWAGATPDGHPCQFDSLGMYMANDLPHPLNERVDVEFQGQKYTLQHPSVVSIADSVAAFDHTYLQGVVPTSTGADAFVVVMDHSAGHDGPVSFTRIQHDWSKDQGVKFQCNDLKLSAPVR